MCIVNGNIQRVVVTIVFCGGMSIIEGITQAIIAIKKFIIPTILFRIIQIRLRYKRIFTIGGPFCPYANVQNFIFSIG